MMEEHIFDNGIWYQLNRKTGEYEIDAANPILYPVTWKTYAGGIIFALILIIITI